VLELLMLYLQLVLALVLEPEKEVGVPYLVFL
jgi:hypothetical protein